MIITSRAICACCRGYALPDDKQPGGPLLLVTHEMRFAFEVSDKIVFMNQGRIEEQGPPKELFERP